MRNNENNTEQSAYLSQNLDPNIIPDQEISSEVVEFSPSLHNRAEIPVNSSNYPTIQLSIPAQDASTGKEQNKPVILRDNRGWVKWKLRGNTLEQDEQIGIQNIQARFLELFPEFDDLFPRNKDGTIDKDLKEQAKRFIDEHIGSFKLFESTMGRSALDKNNVPYFKGNLRYIIKTTFTSWGLDFPEIDIARDSTGRVRWEVIPDEERKAFIKAQVQEFLSEGNKLTTKVLEQTGRTWLMSAIYKYYPGGYKGLLSELGLLTIKPKKQQESQNLPQVDFQTGEYVDREGIIWITPANVYEKFTVSASVIRAFVKETNASVILGRGRNHKPVPLYNKLAIEAYMQSFTSLPHFTRENTQIDTKSWVSVRYLEQKFQIAYQAIQKRLTDTPSIQGRGQNGKRTIFYNEKEASKILRQFVQLPQTDKESHSYTDENGDEWTAAKFLNKRYLWKRNKNQVRFIKGRDYRGREVILLNVADVSNIGEDLNSYPQINRSGIYRDDSNEEWATLGTIEREFGGNPHYFVKNLHDVRTIPGRGVNGVITTLYNKTEILIALEEAGYFNSKNRQDAKTHDEDVLSEYEKVLRTGVFIPFDEFIKERN